MNNSNKQVLLKQETVDAINASHRTIRESILEGADTPTLARVMQAQVDEAESQLLRSVIKLLDKYNHALELAYSKRPNLELTGLLLSAGVEPNSNNNYHDDNEQGHLY